MSAIVDVTCPDCETKYRMFKKEYDLMVGDGERKERGVDKIWLSMKCPRSNEHYMIQLRKRIEAVPHKVKQEILDLMHKSLTIGEVMEIVNLEGDVVSHIISDNLESYGSYLRKDAK